MKKYSIILFLVIVSQLFSKDPYVGYWEMPDGKVIIQIEKVNKEYVGYVRWLKDLTYPKGDPPDALPTLTICSICGGKPPAISNACSSGL